jgi:hypothetical protein
MVSATNCFAGSPKEPSMRRPKPPAGLHADKPTPFTSIACPSSTFMPASRRMRVTS